MVTPDKLPNTMNALHKAVCRIRYNLLIKKQPEDVIKPLDIVENILLLIADGKDRDLEIKEAFEKLAEHLSWQVVIDEFDS